MLILATIFHLVIMPAAEFGDLKTTQNADLFKPYDTGKTYATERDCKMDAIVNMQSYLRARGLPQGAVGNFNCTAN